MEPEETTATTEETGATEDSGALTQETATLRFYELGSDHYAAVAIPREGVEASPSDVAEITRRAGGQYAIGPFNGEMSELRPSRQLNHQFQEELKDKLSTNGLTLDRIWSQLGVPATTAS